MICLREQGIHYNPQSIYFLLTFIYYVATERMLMSILTNLMELFNLESLENLEHLYVPLVLNFYTCVVGVAVEAYLMLTRAYSSFVLLSLYFIVYLRFKDTYFNIWKTILAERKIYASFRAATVKEIEEWNDICAVCLNELTRAKITPCNHFFHPHCLKQCLKNSFLCPLCKRNFAGEEAGPPRSTYSNSDVEL